MKPENNPIFYALAGIGLAVGAMLFNDNYMHGYGLFGNMVEGYIKIGYSQFPIKWLMLVSLGLVLYAAYLWYESRQRPN